MYKILEKTEQYISDNHMLPEGTHVVAGISGGADSMCLLFVLMSLKEKLKLSLCAVHVHHGIRGADADKDADFVKAFCRQNRIMCKTYRGDVPAMARAQKLTEEEAGRIYRYDCFAKALDELGWTDGKIAVAHNKNDVAETLLMNIFRGSGMDGLGAIPPVRGRIIRPLLILTRQEIETLLASENIRFCVDKTNFDTGYMRNRLRNELIPYVTAHINPQAVEHMYELACDARAFSDRIRLSAEAALKTLKRADGSLDTAQLSALEPVIARAVIRMMIGQKAGRLKDISRKHIEQAAALIDKPVGKEVHLPYGLTVRKGYDALYFLGTSESSLKEPLEPLAESEQTLALDGACGTPMYKIVPGTHQIIQWDIQDRPEKMQDFQSFQQNQCTKWFDYDKIKDSLKLRHRRSGDYLVVDSQGSRKLLRRLFIDEKIPKEARDALWVIADGSHILWILGGRMSEAYKITEQTKKILEIKIKGEEYNGR